MRIFARALVGCIRAFVVFCLSAELLHAAEVGMTAGQFSVPSSGAATYSIPIAVPPGTAGMRPQLSIVYSSQGGNGLLGTGFALDGLSSITRCPATLEPDGFIHGVDFTAADRFCLDGQRLVAVTGSYGEPGTEYRTEIESFNRIVSYGGTSGDPGYFKVWTKAGLVMEFGNTSDSRIRRSAVGKALALQASAWGVNRITDTAGNYMTATYQQLGNDTGEYVPLAVSYTGNSATGVVPYNYFKFEYEARPDVWVGYLGGNRSTQSQRLMSIIAFIDGTYASGTGTAVRKYVLSYDQSGILGRTRLISIQESSGVTNLPATTFSWLPTNQNAFSASSPAVANLWGGSGYTRTGDFNGDGLVDVASMDGGNVYMKLSTGNGFVSQTWSVANQWDGNGGNGGYTWIGDFNGDGLADIASANGGNVYVKLSTGSGFISQTWPVANLWGGPGYTWAGDFNGDGLTDIASAYSGNMYMKLSTGSGFGSQTWLVDNLWGGSGYTRTGDFNGDGLEDIASMDAGNVYMKLSTGSSFVSQTWSVANQWDGDGGNGGYTWIGDFNGDGLADIASANSGNIYVKLSTGKGFSSQTWPVDNLWGGPGYTWVSDFNGDGLTDVASANAGNMYMKLSTGSGFVSQAWPVPNQWGGSGYTWVGDFNGDGLADVGSAYGGTLYLKSAVGGRDLIQQITNGLGAALNIVYKPLTDASVYTKGSGARYPFVDVQNALPVVSEHRASDGVGGTRRTTYQYLGLKVHRRGRGMLGFGQRQVYDEATGIREITDFRQEFPFAEMPVKSVSKTTAGLTISETENTYDQVTIGTGSAATYFVYPSKTIERSWEINGINRPVTSKVTQNYYDEPQSRGSFFGNLTRSTTSVYPGRETDGAAPFVTSNTNNYSNDPSLWYLGRLTRSAVTRASPGGDTATRTSAFEYDPVTGLLKAEIVEPDDPALWLRTDYQYDAFGNKTRTTISGPDIQTRETIAEYDPSRGQFPIQMTNALGHVEQRTYDTATGNVLTLTGPNGLTTRWSYDAFGRLIGETRPDGTSFTISRQWCSGTCPVSTGLFKIVKTGSTGAKSEQIFDLLEREVASQTLAFDGGWLRTIMSYNARGEVASKSLPHKAGSAVYYTTFAYDSVGRLTSQTAPSVGTTTLAYDGLTTTETNPLGQRTAREQNALGKLVKVTDAQYNRTENYYDAFDNLIRVVAPGGHTTTMQYDKRGRKITMSDPDMGGWTYTYNALGELIRQQDAKGQVQTLSYDKLGRVVSRTEAEGTSTWTYDTLWKGALTEERGPGFVRSYAYDGLGRVMQTATTVDGRTDTIGAAYDTQSRVSLTTYPTGFRIRNFYNAYGYLSEVRNETTGLTYWRADVQDGFGNVTAFTLGNGARTTSAYDAQTGLLDTIYTSSPKGTVQSLNYDWDNIGNLTARTDWTQSMLKEQFSYDSLNRVQSSTLNGVENLRLTYNAAGNITSKTGVGTYGYGAKPHAVTSISGTRPASYSYDANGNMTAGAGRTIDWTTYNYPSRITQGGENSIFYYGPDRARYKQVLTRTRTTTGGDPTDGYPKAAFAFGCTLMTCRFDAATSTDDRGLVSYRWDFGNGVVTYGSNVSYVYPSAGSYTVTLTVTDTGSQSSFSRATVLVPGAALVKDTTCGLVALPPPLCPPLNPADDALGGPSGASTPVTPPTITETRTVYYVGGLYERQEAGGITEHIHYIQAGGAVIAVYKTSTDGTNSLRYNHYDHLGSVDAVSDDQGRIVQRFSFDAFGKRRVANWTADATDKLLNARHTLDRGYTFHENLDHVALIHMNGRVYDPIIGRFISADPIIQSPDNGQNYNRYSYVVNNPLRYTDPSGHLFGIGRKIKRELRRAERDFRHEIRRPGSLLGSAIVIAAGAVCGPGCAAAASAGVARAQGVTSGRELFKTAFVTYATGRLLQGAGGIESTAGRIAASAFIGGVSSGIGGGNFLSGALSGAAGSVIPADVTGNPYLDTGIAAVVGGTVSEIGGGKFANGAVTGAFAYAFGSLAQGSADEPMMLADAGGTTGHASDVVYGGAPPLDLILFGPVGRVLGAVARFIGLGRSAALTVNIEAKIAGQMGARGWSEAEIAGTVSNPNRVVTGLRDTRHLPGGGMRNDPATAFVRSDGHYVIRNDLDGSVVQISNRYKADWKSPF